MIQVEPASIGPDTNPDAGVKHALYGNKNSQLYELADNIMIFRALYHDNRVLLQVSRYQLFFLESNSRAAMRLDTKMEKD